MAINPRVSISDFEAFLDKHQTGLDGITYELINGEIFADYAHFYASLVAVKIATAIMNYLTQNPIGMVSGEQGGYELTDTSVFAPDVAFISNAKLVNLSDEGFHPEAPDFAIEIVSPSDLKNPRRIREKLAIYKQIKVALVWMVYPRREAVEVYENGILTQTAAINDTLDGGTVLPGFTLAVADFLNIKPGE